MILEDTRDLKGSLNYMKYASRNCRLVTSTDLHEFRSGLRLKAHPSSDGFTAAENI